MPTVTGISLTERRRRDDLYDHLGKQYATIEAAILSPAVNRIVDNFVMKKGNGRLAAFGRLQKVFASAHLETPTVELRGRQPLAVWSFLKPRSAEEWAEEGTHPREMQRCICTYFLAVGKLTNGERLSAGYWSLEYTSHAIGRLVSDQRSPLGMTAEEAMWGGHNAILGASARAVFKHRNDFWLPVEDGAFRCSAKVSPPLPSGRGPVLFVRADSWLHESQLRFRQIVPIAATEESDRLDAFWLQPYVLRQPSAIWDQAGSTRQATY
jgi:hypothetical protein